MRGNASSRDDISDDSSVVPCATYAHSAAPAVSPVAARLEALEDRPVPDPGRLGGSSSSADRQENPSERQNLLARLLSTVNFKHRHFRAC